MLAGALDAAFGQVTRSVAERELLSLLSAADLPLPKTNVRVHGHLVDGYWASARLVIEVDG